MSPEREREAIAANACFVLKVKAGHARAVAEGLPPHFLPLGSEEDAIGGQVGEETFPFRLDLLKRVERVYPQPLPPSQQGEDAFTP